jgi:uncharacterized protein (TIGR03067 family)
MSRFAFYVVILLVSPVLAGSDGNDRTRKDLLALQGKWKTVGGEIAGQPFPKDGIPPFSMVIGADGKSIGQFSDQEFKFTIKIDANSEPKTIVNDHETGAEKGKKQYGIYKLEGDKFTVCVGPAGTSEADRPKKFSSTNSGNVVFVFERVKEAKKP